MKNEQKRWAVGILFVGILFGVFGQLVANMFDRMFIKYGDWYNVAIGMLFAVLLWYVNRFFTKLLLTGKDS